MSLITLVVGGLGLGAVLAQPSTENDLRIIDVNGTNVGKVISVAGVCPSVALLVGEQLVTLCVTQNGFLGNAFIFFEFPNCEGERFLPDTTGFLLPPVLVAPPGNTVYLPAAGSISQTIILQSFLTPEGLCQLIPQPLPVQAFPIEAVEDLNTRFTPPFSIQ